MTAKLRSHIRGNVVGYLALFVALSGSGYAATAARNSVGSKAIKNGQVRSPDLQDNGVAGVDLQDSGVSGPDILDGAVASADIQDGGVGSVDLADGAVQSADLAAGAQGSPAFASIGSNGAINGGRGVLSVDHMMASPTYCLSVGFTPQVAVASGNAGPGDTNVNVQVQVPGGPAGLGCNANQVGVLTEVGGVGAAHSFLIIIN